MKRVQIKLPDEWLFQTQLTVQISDINYGNHLANDAILRLCHEARLRFFASLGYSEMDIAGCAVIMTDAMIQFQGQGFYADQLNIDIGIQEITKIGFDLIYRITRYPDQTAIAIIKTNMVFFDYATQHIQKTPSAFQIILKKSY